METNKLDLIKYITTLRKEKKIIFKSLLVSIIIGIIIGYSIPKRYTTSIILSPESGINNNGNGLAGMASMLGIGGINGGNQDAVNSSMFPDLIKTTPFILEMYDVKVTSQENKQPIPLNIFIENQKSPWWSYILGFPNTIISKFIAIFSRQEKGTIMITDSINPFKLTGKQLSKIYSIKNTLSANIDTKSGMTVVSATLQDPEVAAIVADSAVAKLQKYIIDYRTRKAQEDCNYLEKLCKERKEEYYKAQKAYADFMDANRNVILQRTQAEGTRLQNDMSIAFQIYSQVETQLQVARAKVQEAKPVFAIVEPATIPLFPSGPNRKMIIVAFALLGFICSSTWILFGKDLWNSLKQARTNK